MLFSPPWMAVRTSKGLRIAEKLAMIGLFQKYSPDSFDEHNVIAFLSRMITLYRPNNGVPMRQATRQDAATRALVQVSQELLPKDDHNRSFLVSMMVHFLHFRAPLQWMLQSINGPFLQDDDLNAIDYRFPIILEALKKKLPYRDR